MPSKSATLERYPYATIHADHIGMTKFKGRDNGYKSVYLQLKRWIQDSPRSLSGLDRTVKYRTTLTYNAEAHTSQADEGQYQN